MATDHLRRQGVLTPAEEESFLEVDDWFREHLPEPDFYADGNSVGAVTWFIEPLPVDFDAQLARLLRICANHDLPIDLVHSEDPGRVIHADRYQIGVIPHQRGERSVPDRPLTLVPTSSASKREVAASPIRHLLFDADGVIQELPGGWYAAVEPWLGDRARDFLHTTWKRERPYLCGGDYLPVLAADLASFGVQVPAAELHAQVWQRIELHQPSLDLIAALRRNGYGVHLGTNQEQHRAGYMRNRLGLADHFDTLAYSCELGAAKPEVEFFERALAQFGAEPGQVLFIDDTPANVEGARQAGLASELWTIEQGMPVLIDLLAGHGVHAD